MLVNEKGDLNISTKLSDERLHPDTQLQHRGPQDLLAQVPAAIGLLNGADHRWIYVNNEYVRLTGRNSTADFIGKTLLESLPEIKTQGFLEKLDEAYRTGKPYFGREEQATLNRSAKGLPEQSYWDFVYQPMRNAQGAVEGILVHAVEVTDKVLARKNLADNEERLRLAQTAAQIGTWEWDPVRDFRKLSPELHRLFGTEADDPEHANKWAERVFIADWSTVERCMREGHGSGEMDFEYRYSHPQLGLRWFYCRGRRFANETRMFGIVQDITERKQAEEALRESEERYRTVAETASDAIVSIDQSSTILFANSATAQVFGYEPAEIIGKKLTMLMPDYMRHMHEAGLERYLSTGKKHLDWDATQLPGLHRDGREIPLEVSFGEYTKGGKHYFTGFARDITERKEAEQAVRESERKYRDLAETATIALHWVGPDGTILWANRAELDMLGYAAEEYIGRNITEFHVDGPVINDILDRLCRGEKLREYEARLRTKDGSLRHVIIDSSVLFENGNFVHTRCFTRDITERKQAEQALRESEQKLRVVTDATPVMIWLSGTDKLCYHFNKSWLDFVGRTMEEEMGNGWAENVHPDDFDRCLQIYVSSFDARKPFEMEYRLRHHSGQYRWILDHGVPRFTADGIFEGYVGGCLDIHEQKEAAEARGRLAAIVDSSEDAIISKDLNGIVTSWNPQAERLFGYKKEEMIGRSILTIIPPELHHDEERILSQIKSGNKIDHFETVRVAKSGEKIDVSLSISPVRDEHGNIVGAAKIARDVRESKKIERALRTTEKLAAAGRLAATVAHEINNPLEAINNLVFLAKRDAGNPSKVSDYLRLAERELERVAHIARQTLGFYRDSSAPTRFTVVKAIDDLLFLYEKRFEARNIRVVRQYKNNPEITAFAGEIRQAFSNLISNAIDAMASGGSLVIRVSAAKEWSNSLQPGVRVTILDTGTGVPLHVRKDIFEPFFTTKADVGTGLGLWITKNIVEKHHGNIHFISRTGPQDHGTAFSIFLPLHVPDHAAQPRQTGIPRRITAL